MADDKQAIVLACTSLVVFMLFHTQILFVPSNKINKIIVYSNKLVNNLHIITSYKLHNIGATNTIVHSNQFHNTRVNSLSYLRPLWLRLSRCLHVFAMVPAVNQSGRSFPLMSADKVRTCWNSRDNSQCNRQKSANEEVDQLYVRLQIFVGRYCRPSKIDCCRPIFVVRMTSA